METKVLFLFIAIFFLSCSTKNDSATEWPMTVHLKKNVATVQAKSSEIFASVRCIPLETTDESIVGEIAKVIHRHGNFYISDESSRLFRFNSDGVLTGRISHKGQGPDEYVSISDFDIDDDGNAWILSSHNSILLKYVWQNEAEAMTRIPLKGRAMGINIMSPETAFYFISNEVNEDDPNRVRFFNPLTGEPTGSDLPVDPHKAEYLHTFGGNHFSHGYGNGNGYFHDAYNDTVYLISGNRLVPYLTADYYGQNITPAVFSRNYRDIMDFYNHISENGYAWGTYAFIEGEKSLLLSYNHGDKRRIAIISKEGLEVISDFSELVEDTHLRGYVIDIFKGFFIQQQNYELVAILQPFEIMEYFASKPDLRKDIEKNIHFTGDEQNPVLLLMTIP